MSDDLDELERHVRSLWGDLAPRPALDAGDRAVAAKLLGKENFGRLDRAKSGDRVKYRPVRTLRVEYYRGANGGWTIEGIETTGRRVVAWGLKDGDCYRKIQTLEQAGHTCRFIITEPMRAWGLISPPRPDMPETDHRFSRPTQGRSKRFDADWLRSMTR